MELVRGKSHEQGGKTQQGMISAFKYKKCGQELIKALAES